MKFSAMFSPVQIGSVTVPNRFMVPSMGNNLANTDGSFSARSFAYYQARAKGGFGLITLEATVVYEKAKGGPRKPCLFSDDTVQSYRQVIDGCHQYGSKVSVQLQHAGPEGSSALTGYPLQAASPVPAALGREIPEAVSNEELYHIIDCYADAAARAQQAGADMVEIHCAHGYFISTFVSERTNHRTDEFGGCFENRMRLPRLIIEAIRKKTGGTLPIICRINGCDEMPGGQSVHDAAAVAAYLEEECGVDALHVSRATHLHDEFMWAPGITHGGFNAELVSKIKRAVSVPVITVGRFTEPQYAELMVKEGRADLIAFGRQSIADPELPNKAAQGRLEELTPCIGCLLGCVPNMFAGEAITCAVNPCVGREREMTPSPVSKKVVVVGGGPGGLYAAWACALRGHQVTLLEKEAELGGNFRIAAYPPGKGQLTALVRSLIVRCRKAGVTIRCGTAADAAQIRALSPDALILAAGSTPIFPKLPGLDLVSAVSAQELLEGKVSAGQKVLVVGGGMVGCETAAFLAERGHQVTVVELKDTIAADVPPENRRCLFDLFRTYGVRLYPGCQVKQFSPHKVDYTGQDGTDASFGPFDTVVLAVGSRANHVLGEEAERLAPQVFEIGDAARTAGNALLAARDAFEVCLKI